MSSKRSSPSVSCAGVADGVPLGVPSLTVDGDGVSARVDDGGVWMTGSGA